MSIRSGVLAAVTSLVLMLALGNEWVVDKAFDGDVAVQTRSSVVGSLRWQIWELPSDVRGAAAVHLVVLIALTFVLGGIAGRSRGLTALLGGWAAFLAASVVSLGIYGLLLDQDFARTDDVIDQFSGSAGYGAPLGMWLGWLVGIAVLIGSKPPVSAPAGGFPPAAPPPSWPPGASGDPGPVAAPPPPYTPTGPSAPGPFPEPPAADPPPFPEAPPPSPGGPVIGPPPDRTQVYPPHQP